MSAAEGNCGGIPPRTKQTALIVAVALVVLLGAALLWRGSRGGQPPAPAQGNESTYRGDGGRSRAPVSAGTAELALLAPLVVGSSVGDAEVVHISGVEEGLIHVDLRKDGAVMHFAVGLVHEGYNAQRVGRYAVYIWERTPTPAASLLAEALARSLRPHADRPPPAGLTSGTFNAPPH